MSMTDAIASAGVSLLLLAFFLNQRGWVGQQSPLYLWLNLFGAVIAGAAAWMGDLIPFVVLEAVWAGVASWGLLALLKTRETPLPR